MASVATKEGKNRIVTRNEWLEKRLELLAEEKRVAKEISKLNEIVVNEAILFKGSYNYSHCHYCNAQETRRIGHGSKRLFST